MDLKSIKIYKVDIFVRFSNNSEREKKLHQLFHRRIMSDLLLTHSAESNVQVLIGH